MNRPDLSAATLIAMDIETYDPALREMGSPGVFRKDGYVLGFSLATPDGFAEYYDLNHPGCSEETRTANLAYLREVAALPVPKIGAHLLYDLDWISNFLGIPVSGPFHDVQTAEPLIDEYQRSYSLDYLGQKYLKRGKEKNAIDAFCVRNGLTGDSRIHLYRMPYALVRPYGIEDARLPIDIFEHQRPILEEQGLMPVYTMETELFPLLIAMRKNGVRVSRERIEESAREIVKMRDDLRDELWQAHGAFNYNSSKQLAELFDSLGIEYAFTDKGNPKLGKDELALITDPVAEKIIRVRESEKILTTFLNGAFIDHDIDGRIYSMFYPLRQDEGGTVSGRFSSQGPNLQQIPGRDEVFGRLCRRVFIPEEGCLWGKIDYSQIEYRAIAHYATGLKSDEIREHYKNNPKTDYHQLVMDWTGVDRSTAKRLNFGMAYFMGVASMARKFQWDVEYAKDLQELYFNTVPFMKPTRSNVVNVAKGRGYIRTILGRRARVSPDMRANKKEYVMFNRLIQGSAADIFKKQMVDAWKAGIYDVLTPHVIVHDENGVSVPKTRAGLEAYRELKDVMEKAVELKVPIIADAEIGTSWGELEECNFDEQIRRTLI